MSLNVTVNGYTYLGSGSLAGNVVKYQALWYPNGTASSPTTWNDVRVTEATGYWNCNLGDADWLSQEGVALSGGKIIIVFWKGSTTDRNDVCSVLDEWGTVEITHDGSATYSIDTQIKANIAPNLVWSLPSDGLVSNSYTANNNSYDVHNWLFNTVTMYHWRNRYGQSIMEVNNVNNSDYYWGDGDSDEDVSGVANRSHTWNSAGDYDVRLVIEDECGATVTGTKSIRIKWNSPTADITMSPVNPEPNEEVYFQWSGTDVDNRITSIDWVIEDNGPYGNTSTTTTDSRDASVPHSSGLGTDWCGQSKTSGAFTNPGVHDVQIVIHWNDGFDDQTVSYNENFTQSRFSGPAVDFSQDPERAVLLSEVDFNNDSTNTDRVGLGLPDCVEYKWVWTEDGSSEEVNDVDIDYVFSKTPGSIDSVVTLCAYWSDGWDTNESCVEKNVVFETTVTVSEEDCYYNLNLVGTSSDGSVDSYSWTVASGIDSDGPWVTTWYSPNDIYQNDKKVCFTATGWYKITGYVYGTGYTTSDDEVMYIDTVCPPSEGTSYIWDGTGVNDVGGEWDHSGYGIEASNAKHSGTNGLSSGELSKNNKVIFTKRSGYSNIFNYGFLIMWMNIKSWEPEEDISVILHRIAGPNSSINLSRYITTDALNVWQKVLIPLTHFTYSSEDSDGHFDVDKITLKPSGEMEFWLDDMTFGFGTVTAIPVCPPESVSIEYGKKNVRGDEIVPAATAPPTVSAEELVPSGQARRIVPSGRAEIGDVPSMRPRFPRPL
jgi:hypothetical protein